ncbi:MAG TPA: alpha/beta fold hydrolase [Acidimicrobiia bacterium]|nr:alpha/beta fold hydrolase [Acidimicrobiia bacterium]
MSERTFVDRHGVEVFTRWWTLDAPEGVVLVSHGASEHSQRYDRFARALNAAGFAAVALDHRGHGQTAAGADRALMGPGGGDAVVDDLHELRDAVRAELGDVPTFLFGHSLGALIGLAYLIRHADGLAGAVLCGFPADPDGAAALGEMLRGLADAGMRDEPLADLVATDATSDSQRTRYDWLSRDADEVDRYVADPLCGDDHPLTYGYLLDLFGVVAPARERLSAITCPVFVIAGDQDPAAGMGAHPTALAKALEADGVDVELQLYEGARHELLNETNRDDVTADLIAWFRAHR